VLDGQGEQAIWSARAESMAKQTKITIETDSILVLRGRKPSRAWCADCGAEEEMIPLNDVGIVSNLPRLEVEAWMQAEDLHHSVTSDGVSLICLSSILNRLRKSTIEVRPNDEQS
jgi:hypothetical protein